MSNSDLRYPSWQRPLKEAILDLDREELVERLQKIETLFLGRFQTISSEIDYQDERESLAAAVLIVRLLKKDVRRSQALLSTVHASSTRMGIVVSRKGTDIESKLFASIVNSSRDAVISKTLDGVITSWNDSARQLFGYSADETIGKDIRLIIPRDRLKEEELILENLKNGVRIDHFDTIRLRKDGTRIDVSVTISPIKDPHGRIVGASKMVRDISATKHAERKLRSSEQYLRLQVEGLMTRMDVATEALDQQNAEVIRQSEALRQLSHSLLKAQDEERRTISRDLHDSAGQILTVLGLNMTRMRKDSEQGRQIGKSLEDSENLVQQLSDEIRTMSYLLHPPLLDEIGLPQAIDWYANGLMERSGLKIAINVSDGFDRLPSDIELALFRVLQECLTNIHRHSSSKTAKISLSRRAETVSLEIVDEGQGIPVNRLAYVEKKHAGVGITGMRERVRHIGGTMAIQSNDGGTKVLFTVPIPDSALSTDQRNIM
jgi:PAS domain S-box-containing protein